MDTRRRTRGGRNTDDGGISEKAPTTRGSSTRDTSRSTGESPRRDLHPHLDDTVRRPHSRAGDVRRHRAHGPLVPDDHRRRVSHPLRRRRHRSSARRRRRSQWPNGLCRVPFTLRGTRSRVASPCDLMLWPSVRRHTARNALRSTDTADHLLNAPTGHHSAGNEHHREHHHDHHHSRNDDHLDNVDKCPSRDDNYSSHSRGNDDNFDDSSDDRTSHDHDGTSTGSERSKSARRNFDDHDHRRQYHHPATEDNLDDHNDRSSGSTITTDNVSRTAAYNRVTTRTHDNRRHPDRRACRTTRRRATSVTARGASEVRVRREPLLRQVRLLCPDGLTSPGQRTTHNNRGDYNGRGEHSRSGKEAAMNWLRENVWVYVGTGLVLLTLTGPTLKNALLLSLTGTAIHLFATYFDKD